MEPSKVLEQCVARAHKRPIIRMGSSGPVVREWQALVAREVGTKLALTGVFDLPTQAATMAFQRKAGLPPDGVVASRTWAAAAVAPCYALALAQQKAGGLAKAKSHWWDMGTRQVQVAKPATHGLGVLGLSFSVLDTKSMVLGGVLGLGLGAVLFRRR